MDESTIFSILGIEKTKNKELLKQAYRNLLVKTNPEDNPEGFKRIRQAYEEACIFADREEEEEKKNTPIEIWMNRVKEIYASFSKRMDLECWREVLKDDVIIDFETAEEARNALFYFLMSHFRLKPEVFLILDEIFDIRGLKKELYERFPKDFIEFMCTQCEEKDGFPFELFKGADDANYDLALNRYYEIGNHINANDWNLVPKLMEEMEATQVSHPYLTLVKVRYFYVSGQIKKALEEFLPIYKEYPQLSLCVSYGAQLFWEDGQKDKASELYQKVLECDKKQYLPNRNLAQYYYERGEYEKAQEYCEEAIRINEQESELIELLHSINEKLIPLYEEEQRTEKENFAHYLNLAWCYLQNDRTENCFIYLKEQVPDSQKNGEYYDLLARNYILREEMETSSQCFQKEINLLKEEREKLSGEEKQKNIEHSASASGRLAQVYFELAKKGEESYYDLALQALDAAFFLMPNKIQFLLQKAEVAIKKKDFELAKKVCDQILSIDGHVFFAYVKKQEASFEEGDDQAVIDLFYQMKTLYAGYSKSYVYAIRSFLRHNQYKDAEDILAQAEEAKVIDPELKLVQASVFRQKAETRDEIKEALKLVEEAMKEIEEKDQKLCVDAYTEKARCENYLNENEEALKSIQKAIDLQSGDDFCFWIKGGILLDMRRFEEAISEFKACERSYPSSKALKMNIGRCYQELGQLDAALEAYQMAEKLDPTDPSTLSELTDVCRELLIETGDLKFYEQGLIFADRQIEISKSVDTYNDRGLLHMAADRLEQAEKDYERAQQYDRENPHVLNNRGCILNYTDREAEAEAYFKAAVMNLKNEKHPSNQIFLSNLGRCMLRLKRYPEAIGIYERMKKNAYLTEYYHNLLVLALRKMKRYEEAANQIEKRYYQQQHKAAQKLAELYYYAKDLKKMRKWCFKLFTRYRNKENLRRIYELFGNAALYRRGNLSMADFFFQLALKMEKSGTEEHRKLLLKLMELCYFRKKNKKLSSYQRMLTQDYEKCYGGEQEYLNQLMKKKEHWYYIGIARFYMGDKKGAIECLKEMDACYKCRDCVFLHCKKREHLKGLLAEEEKENAVALECYKKGYDIDEEDDFFEYRLKQLEDRKD